MVEKSTIFIPDISGYTQFVSKSELDHNAMILTNLIECIIECNTPNFTVSEVEGDAVLFYKIGEPVPMSIMFDHCIDMYNKFHARLIEMAKGATCQCHACDELIKMSLKFVIHYGDIRELQMAHFKKASGVNMIIAHRLLKNDIGANEYILATDSYLRHFDRTADHTGLKWKKASTAYDSIGAVNYEYAVISERAVIV